MTILLYEPLLLSGLLDLSKVTLGFLAAILLFFTITYLQLKRKISRHHVFLVFSALVFEAGLLCLDLLKPAIGSESFVSVGLLGLPAALVACLLPSAFGLFAHYKHQDDERSFGPSSSTSSLWYGFPLLYVLAAFLSPATWWLVLAVPVPVYLYGASLFVSAFGKIRGKRMIGLNGYSLALFALGTLAVIAGGFGSYIEAAWSPFVYALGTLSLQVGVLAFVFVFMLFQEKQLLSSQRMLEAAGKELEYRNDHDTLTGLYNRAAFFARLDYLRTQDRHVPRAILYLDLDRFRVINDSLGRSSADTILQMVAEKLTVFRGDVESVFRTGEDEFALLIECPSSEVDAAFFAEEILHHFEMPFHIKGIEVFLTASIGITFLWDSQRGKLSDSDEIIRQIDQALEIAKLDRNTYRFYTPHLSERGTSKLQYVNFLRQAIDRNELSLHFQPQVDFKGKILGAEALLRWNNPILGSVPPSEFIGMAEEAGLIIPIGEWVIEQACAELAHWHSLGLFIPLSINISTRQLKDPRLERSLVHKLKKYGLHTGTLSLEITESSIFEDNESTLRTLSNLDKLGFKLSIDDFGTGYANLSYLKRLPVSAVKIDRSFIVDLPDNHQDMAVVQAICNMARKMGLSIVAEGVDCEKQVAVLHAAECTSIQGFLFSRPLPSKEFIRFAQACA